MIDVSKNHNNGSSSQLGSDPQLEFRRNRLGTTVMTPHRSPAKAGLGGNNWKLYFRSFKRRWFSTIFLGLLVGVAAGVTAWFLVPAPYSTRAELRMSSDGERFFFKTNETQPTFDVRKQTSMKLVTSTAVLNAALNDLDDSGLDVNEMAFFKGSADHIETLADSLKVSSAGHEFFSISLVGEDPKEIAGIVNAVSKAFMDEVVYKERDLRNARVGELQLVADKLKQDLEFEQAKLKKLIQVTNSSTSAMVEQKQNSILQTHVNLRQQIAQVDMELIKASAALRIREGVEEDAAPLDIPDAALEALVLQEPQFVRLQSQVDRLTGFAERAEKTFTPGSFKITEAKQAHAAAKAELDNLRQALRPQIIERLGQENAAQIAASDMELRNEIASLRAFKVELEKELDGLKIQEKAQGVISFDLENADRAIGKLEARAAAVNEEIVNRTFEIANARDPIVPYQDAVVPSDPDLAQRKKMSGVAGLGGFGFVALAIVLLDSLSRKISSVEEVSGDLSMRLIGAIPSLPKAAMIGESRDSNPRSKSRFWQSALKESIDSARTYILGHAERENLQVLMVGSAVSSEGKTTLSCHLATSLARSGRRIVLLDCDLRRPAVDRVFDVNGDVGICEILRGEVELDEALQPTAVPGLFVIPAGIIDAVALERVSSDGLESIISRLRNEFDFVIVDSSPVLPVCDALLVARHVDAVLLAVRKDISRLSKVAATIERFAAIDVAVLGAVAIGLDDDPVAYGGYFRNRDRYGYTGYMVSAN